MMNGRLDRDINYKNFLVGRSACMRRQTILRYVSFTCYCFIAGSTFASDFDGAWELISGEYVDGSGKLVDYQTMNMKSMKILADGHYQFISMAGEKFWASGAGTFQVDGEFYVETPRFVSYPIEPNTVYQFRFQLDGELWQNERWQDGRRVELEVWRRLSPPSAKSP